MASSAKPTVLRVADGGRLVTSASLENVGAQNWSRKLNMRRTDKDQEGRVEGWEKFVDEDGYEFDATETVLTLAELVRPNGDRKIVGCGRTAIKAFDVDTGLWADIAGGFDFSPTGKRAQTATINGSLLLNNAVDLPLSYRVEDPTVKQIEEMRQVGYARVGRISEYNGFLMIGDLTRIKSQQLDKWMNGYSSYTTTSSVLKITDFTLALSDNRKQFNFVFTGTDITVTLPALTFSDRFYCWFNRTDSDLGVLRTSPVIQDEEIALTTINDKALVWWTGTAWAAKIFPSGVIPATDPYGVPPESIIERYPWAVANSEFGQPTKWAPAFAAVMQAASTEIVLPFAPSTWIAGTTRVAVINGGPEGATLGGQEGYEDGILVTAIGTFDPAKGGVPITLELTTDAGIDYPRAVTVTRFTDISTIVAEYQLVGDSSEIMGMQPLGEQLILYRTTCIWVGRYTGNLDDPFVWVPRFPSRKQSLNLPIWGDAIADANGDYHLYPGVGGRFYAFDGTTWPEIHQVCDDARELFFEGVKDADEVFVMANPYTKSFYFCRPELTFSYDFEFSTVSEIDVAFNAGAFVRKPGATDRWFILAIGRFVYTYGLVTNAETNLKTYLRDGEVPTAMLKSGLFTGDSMVGEGDMMSYCPVLASSSPDVAVEIQLYSTYNPSGPLTTLLTPVESLPTPEGENFFTTAFRAMFFMDEITLVDERDLDFRISQRIIEINGVGRGWGVPRRVLA